MLVNQKTFVVVNVQQCCGSGPIFSDFEHSDPDPMLDKPNKFSVNQIYIPFLT